jgi:hypothetical protein
MLFCEFCFCFCGIHRVILFPETPGTKLQCVAGVTETPGTKIHRVISFPETPGTKIQCVAGVTESPGTKLQCVAEILYILLSVLQFISDISAIYFSAANIMIFNLIKIIKCKIWILYNNTGQNIMLRDEK